MKELMKDSDSEEERDYFPDILSPPNIHRRELSHLNEHETKRVNNLLPSNVIDDNESNSSYINFNKNLIIDDRS